MTIENSQITTEKVQKWPTYTDLYTQTKTVNYVQAYMTTQRMSPSNVPIVISRAFYILLNLRRVIDLCFEFIVNFIVSLYYKIVCGKIGN